MWRRRLLALESATARSPRDITCEQCQLVEHSARSLLLPGHAQPPNGEEGVEYEEEECGNDARPLST